MVTSIGSQELDLPGEAKPHQFSALAFTSLFKRFFPMFYERLRDECAANSLQYILSA